MGDDARTTSLPMPARRHRPGESHSSHERIEVHVRRRDGLETLVFTTPEGEAHVELDPKIRAALAGASADSGDRLRIRPQGARHSKWSVLREDVRAFVAADDERLARGGGAFPAGRMDPPSRTLVVAALRDVERSKAGRAMLRVERGDLEEGARSAMGRLLAAAPDAVVQPVYARDPQSMRIAATDVALRGRDGIAHLADGFGAPGARRRIHLDTEVLEQAVDAGAIDAGTLRDVVMEHEGRLAGERAPGKEATRGGGDVER